MGNSRQFPGKENMAAVAERGRQERRLVDGTVDSRKTVFSGVLVGVGVAGFVDETVFHQILHWHHFYDKSTPTWGLISDGIFHAGSWFALVIGLVLFADLRRRLAWSKLHWWGGFLLGLGGFQLYDGTIQHKWWGLHQIRYHVTIWPYDTVWNVLAAIAILIGVAFLLRARRATAVTATP
jgi:uncharacterized membrane protein